MTDEKTIVVQHSSDLTNTGHRASAPVLLQYDGGAAGKRFVLNGDHGIIGRRADKVDVWIDDASVSREHCRVDFAGTQARVMDLGSLNHTYINDQIVMQTAELCHGDMLRVGNVRLRYFAHGSADQLLFDRIYRMAVQDRMLEIFRKEFVMERLDEEFRIAKAQALNLSLMFFDLDRFKVINDTFGHDAGDHVLKEVCHLVKSLVKATDIFGRYGGEEFCIVHPKTTLDEAHKFAEVVRLACEKTIIEYEGVIIPVTLSIGVAEATAEITTPIDLIKAADTLVYKSKQEGRNRVSR